ncbi:MAG: hypothetical protein AB2A00_14890 [Myxococcota bacterium]
MVATRRWVPLTVLAGALACASAPSVPEHGGGRAGVTTGVFHDEKRARTLVTEIWYPAVPDAEEHEETFNIIWNARAARDARMAGGPPRPLVLFSHGSGGTRHDLAWLARALAREGYLVAAVTHPGNTYQDNDPLRRLEIWQRPQDVRAVLDGLLAHPFWGPRVDRRHISAVGHSLGGYTVLAVAGARYDVKRAREHCLGPDADAACRAAAEVDRSRIDYRPSGLSYRDGRVRAVVALAPAVGPGFDERSAAEVTVPVHIISGLQDDITLHRLHAARWANLLHAELTVLDEANHYTFINPCNALGSLGRISACADAPRADRLKLQAHVRRVVLDFLRRRG